MKRFYPDYLIEIIFFALVVVELNIILALAFPPDIGREIDFTTAYQPRPEWYYLWLFGLLRYFSGKYALLGGVVIPFVAVAILFLVPWLDKKPGRVFTIVLVGILLSFFVISIFLYN